MGSELKLQVRWLPLLVGLATTASCGIFPGRDFGGSIGDANDSPGSAGSGGSGGVADSGPSRGDAGTGDSGTEKA